MISLKEYQDALKIVEAYRRQQYIKQRVNVDPNYYALMGIYDIYIPKGMIYYLELIAKCE